MRVSSILSAVLAAGVIGQGAYIVRLRQQVSALSQQVDQLATERPAADCEPVPARGGPAPVPTATGHLAPPRFAPPTAPAGAVPPPSPESASAQRQRERDELKKRLQERHDRRLQSIVQALGLGAQEGGRLTGVVAAGRTARSELMEKFQAKTITRDEMRSQFRSLWDQEDQQLRQLLGNDRLQKFRDLERQAPRGGEDPPR